jgi:hypothetical protein
MDLVPTNPSTNAQEALMEFSNITAGTLPAGTVTDHGVIARSTLTAYEMTDGRFVPFATIHGRPAFVLPLVVFS